MPDNTTSLPAFAAARHYLIATDGACKGNPGPGGWAALIQLRDGDTVLRQRPIAGFVPHTTNIRMEMTAPLMALAGLREIDTPTLILADNEMLVKGMTEWLPGWKAKGWRRKKGPVANADIWQELDRIDQERTTAWTWVRGHDGHELNEIADTLADNAAQGKYGNKIRSLSAFHPELIQ